MSESTLSNVTPARAVAHNLAQIRSADLRMLAQVEKWMAMICEINREHPGFAR